MVRTLDGCCMSEEGDVLFKDYHVKSALFTTLASYYRLKCKMPLDHSWGFDITLIDGKTVAITTGGSGEKIDIDIINTKNRSKIKFIDFPGCPFGITRYHGSLFVCVKESGIFKINMLDYTTSHVISCNLPPCSYVSVFSDKIYYTDYTDHSVVCCDHNGSAFWTFKDTLVLNEPEGIAVDNNGNVYVVGEKSSNVVIISSDGKHHKQILTENDGLYLPSAIFLDKQNRKLIVANTNATAFLYKIL
ncbi:unnamed protein product [Mytilus edulis]|uniref:Uncharacterized protein n=1 Tax=Mytilus edulis TaxID=6550 RepID=A0A8S3SW15_MYTED|nr:unnamed protein product [Mytilus edulis]